MSGKSQYEVIRDDMRAKIDSGAWPIGQLIPTELQLAETYQVSRPTIRHAMQDLVNEGRLERRRRRGTIACAPKIDQGFTLSLRSFADEMIANERIPRTQVLMLKRETASRMVAQALKLDEGAPVFKLVRVRFADNVPNVINESYIPAEPVPAFDTFDFQERSMYDVLRELGCPVVAAKRRLEVVRANPTQASLLDVETGDPLFLFTSVGMLEDGTPMEYSIATYRGESNSFEFEVSLKKEEAHA